ncbi:MAG: hypothetical protein AABZ23_02360 [Deltaproteobacteria bacterium]
MNRVSIGTNLIEDCENLIVIESVPLFSYKIEADTLKLSFNIKSPPSNMAIDIEDNRIKSSTVTIKHNKGTAKITIDEKTIFELHLKNDLAVASLDLRPLGLHIFTDQNALYVGGAQLSQNIIKNCKNGISVGG